jgi:hypothetical protein
MIRVFTDQVQNYNIDFHQLLRHFYYSHKSYSYRHLKRVNQRLKAASLTNRTRSYKIDFLLFLRPAQEYFTFVPLKNISLSRLIDYLRFLRPAQEIFTYMETSPLPVS